MISFNRVTIPRPNIKAKKIKALLSSLCFQVSINDNDTKNHAEILKSEKPIEATNLNNFIIWNKKISSNFVN